MRDYWLTQYLLAGVGWIYIIATLTAMVLALWLPKGKKAKVSVVAVVIGLASFLPIQGYQEYRKEQEAAEAYKERLAKAQALFEERCKTAGEKIYKTVESVEGVFVIKPRNEELNYGEQFKLDDPYGYAGTGENYLKLFVRGRTTVPAKTGELISPANVVSYKFAEIADEAGTGFYRYTTAMPKEESERITRNGGGVVLLTKIPIATRSARYGITWDDISTKVDRENWIAGSSQKIVDMQTNEVVAERIGYMFDIGLGDKTGGRSPWAVARDHACPPLNEKTFYFFDRVIKPTGEKTK